MDDGGSEELVRRMIDAICSVHGVSSSVEEAAREWISAGFEDPEEVGEWLRARCYTPAVAEVLDNAGITPEQAAMRTRAGTGEVEDTIGHKVATGDLSVEEARRIVTSHFWDLDARAQ